MERARIRTTTTVDSDYDNEERRRPAPAGGGFVIPLKKGERKGGRVKGQPNKITRQLKDAIIMAAEQCGEDGKGKDQLVGYLKRLARNYPKTFAALLGRVLPMQITGKIEGEATLHVKYKSVEEVKAELKERGLPIPDRVFH